MHILHLSPSYKPAFIYGGPTLSMSKLCEAQAKLNHQVTVFTTTANGSIELEVKPGKEQIVDGVKVYYFHRWTKDHSHFSPTLLLKLFQSVKQYQVVHIHSWWNLVTMPAVFICWIRGVKPVLSPRGMLSQYTLQGRSAKLKMIFHKLIGKWLLSKTILHATAPQEVKDTTPFLKNWEHVIAPNIIELPKATDYKKPSNSEVIKLLFLSRIHPKKGLEFLFEALSKSHFQYELHVAGKGDSDYEAQLKEYAKELGISSQIKWFGWADTNQKYKLLHEADLFVLTSHNENFANAVLESLAVGTPVLVSDQVGLSEYVQSKKLGWVCTTDPKDIQAKLEEIIAQPQQLLEINQRAATQVRKDFDPAVIAQQYLDAYQKHIKNNV
ncbi:MAG: glycosyltransferase [Bacteroidota bacterium]